MNAFVRHVCFGLVALFGIQTHAFENLDFEQAMPVATGDEFDVCCNQNMADILPHWSGVQFEPFNNESGFMRAYNTAHIGGVPAILAVFDTDTDLWGSPLSGEYSAAIDTRGQFTAELFQTGQVPTDSQSIRFSGALHTSGLFDNSFPLYFMQRAPAEQIEMYLGGTKLEVLDLSDEGGFATYGANIPPTLAGTVAELRFIVPTDYFLLLDDISFSPIPVPEPCTGLILVIAICTCISKRRSRN